MNTFTYMRHNNTHTHTNRKKSAQVCRLSNGTIAADQHYNVCIVLIIYILDKKKTWRSPQVSTVQSQNIREHSYTQPEAYVILSLCGP